MITTTDKVIAIRQEQPTLKAMYIADMVGVTRERVRQILKKAELPTRFPKKHKIPGLVAQHPNLTVGEIAELAGVDRGVVKRYFQSIGKPTLDVRQERALRVSGHSDWKKCCRCHQYDDPKNMYEPSYPTHQHRECYNKHMREYLKRKRLEQKKNDTK